MIYRLYEWRGLSGIQVLPSQVCFMITGDDLWAAPHKLDTVVTWCHEVNRFLDDLKAGPLDTEKERAIRGVTFHISTEDPSRMDPFLPFICRVADMGELHLHAGNREEVGVRWVSPSAPATRLAATVNFADTNYLVLSTASNSGTAFCILAYEGGGAVPEVRGTVDAHGANAGDLKCLINTW